MRLRATALLALTSACALVHGQQTAYGQCGGMGWSGATACVSGYVCTEQNSYYSQCVPGTAGAAPTTTAPAHTTTSTASGAPGTSSVPATTTASGAAPTGSQIRSDQDPVYHFYLQNLDGVPVLGPEASSGYFVLGSTITLNGMYLNVNETGSASYKSLSFGTTATTTDWGLEGDTIITTAPRQLNFVACPTSNTDYWSIYLQEGNDTPSSSCANDISLHLDCLC